MKHILFLLIILASLCYTHLFAQWQTCNGPYGGSLNALTNNGSVVFAGTYSGCF